MDFDTLFLIGICATFAAFMVTLGYVSMHGPKRR
jgi:hypothetical protein